VKKRRHLVTRKKEEGGTIFIIFISCEKEGKKDRARKGVQGFRRDPCPGGKEKKGNLFYYTSQAMNGNKKDPGGTKGETRCSGKKSRSAGEKTIRKGKSLLLRGESTPSKSLKRRKGSSLKGGKDANTPSRKKSFPN